jgi:hypothetical protein
MGWLEKEYLPGAGPVKIVEGTGWVWVEATSKIRWPKKSRCNLHFDMASFWFNRSVLV